MRLSHTLACGLLVAIFFVVIQSPSNEKTNATPHSSIESLLDRLAKNDEAMLTLITQHGHELADIEECQVEETETIRTQLVALQTKVEATQSQAGSTAACECTCNCEAELNALRKRVEDLEALCKAPQKANYPSSGGGSSPPRTGYGSTGSTVSGFGSTGSQVAPVQKSYGSTGSAVFSEPVVTYSYAPTPAPVLPRPTVTTSYTETSSSCYVDANGNTVCDRRGNSIVEQPSNQGWFLGKAVGKVLGRNR